MHDTGTMINTKLTYFRTNTIVIEKRTTKLIIDPHFYRPGAMHMLSKIGPNIERVADGFCALQITKLDAVLLTHIHYDHAMDVPEILHQVGGTLYGSTSAMNLMEEELLVPSYYLPTTFELVNKESMSN